MRKLAVIAALIPVFAFGYFAAHKYLVAQSVLSGTSAWTPTTTPQVDTLTANQFISTGPGPFVFSGLEGTCSGATSGRDVLCIGDLTTHTLQVSTDGNPFHPLSTGGFTATFDGGGSSLVTATAYNAAMPYGCQIASTDIRVDQGTATFTFWDRATGDTADPTSADTITTVGISFTTGNTLHTTATTGIFNTGTGLAITAGDKMAVHIVPAAGMTYATVEVTCTK